MAATTAANGRRLLVLQGWTGDDLDQAAAAGIWVRWAPALCLAGVIAGTALASPALLLALACPAVAGAVRPSHPFDAIYNHGLRHVVHRPPLPPNRAARRSACALAAAWLTATAGAFALRASAVGYVLGSTLAVAGAVFTLGGLCLPSLLFTLVLGAERAQCRTLTAALSSHPGRTETGAETSITVTS